MRLKTPRPGHRASQMELSHRLPNNGRSTQGRYKAQMLWSPQSKELNQKAPKTGMLGSGQLKQAGVKPPRVGQVGLWPAPTLLG